MRPAALLSLLLAGCCSLPPAVHDPTTPENAYRSFRTALAEEDHEKEFGFLSNGLRERLGVSSWVEWSEVRQFLHRRHRLVRGIVCSRVEGRAVLENDGRARLEVRFPFGYRARVWMRPVPVFRVHWAEEPRPWETLLPALNPVTGEAAAGVAIPPDLARDLADHLASGHRMVSQVARIEWFVDDFDARDETPDTVRTALDEEEQSP